MANVEVFLVLFHVGYLNNILILDTKYFLNYTLDLGGFMKWVGFWVYMACWFGIAVRREWWSVTIPVIHIGYPFWLNQYMSHH